MKIEERSPLYQNLPNCAKNDFVRIKKKTTKRAVLCPMIKDEEGFLSEWVAYYQMHGFEHIYLYNDGSTDKSLVELKPWIDSGFVTVKSNFTLDSLKVKKKMRNQAFTAAMAVKALLETDCKFEAIKMGYDYQMSIDMDEFVIPVRPGVTIVDEVNFHSLHEYLALKNSTSTSYSLFMLPLCIIFMSLLYANHHLNSCLMLHLFPHRFFMLLIVQFDSMITETGRSSFCMDKLNFQSTPHILEPINLLTIEAYQTRMKPPSQMNYYTTVMRKCGYRLSSPQYRNITSEYVAKCCHFHGCQAKDFIEGDNTCDKNYRQEAWQISGEGLPFKNSLYINHYSRSLEKYALKQKTWKTSSGEHQEGQSSESASSSYDLPKFFARSVGFHFDNTALRYTCQLRELMRKMTGEMEYLRPGNFWYRNPEFGKHVSDPEKRGRYGRPNAPGFKYTSPNPYNYHGGLFGEKNADRSAAEKIMVLADIEEYKKVAEAQKEILREEGHAPIAPVRSLTPLTSSSSSLLLSTESYTTESYTTNNVTGSMDPGSLNSVAPFEPIEPLRPIREKIEKNGAGRDNQKKVSQNRKKGSKGGKRI